MAKVAELAGAELDYWVARAGGKTNPRVFEGTCVIVVANINGFIYSPSTDWTQGGPLIEKHVHMLHHFELEQSGWLASAGSPKVGKAQGDTALQAICRAVVRSVFGDEVPDENR